MFKNLSPNQLSVLVAVTASILFGTLYVLLGLVVGAELRWGLILLVVILGFPLGFIAFRYFLQQYIYRKVKLIYKVIHQAKSSTKGKQMNMNDDILGIVDKEVYQWAEDRKKQIEDLKTLENYRRNFLGNISHELKTPIFSLQGYLFTLLEGGLYDEQINMKYLRNATRNIDRLITIVEDLESISKLESGEMELDIQRFDIKKLVQEVIEDVEMQANAKGVKLSLKQGANQSAFVMADRENIRQVILNLVVNSIKYGKNGGETKIGFYDMDKYLLVEVADNGLGIEERHLPHLFDRFYRVDKSRSRELGGSGLGLSIVKHIIEAHGQTINVRSTIGVGSTFGFTLAKAK